MTASRRPKRGTAPRASLFWGRRLKREWLGVASLVLVLVVSVGGFIWIQSRSSGDEAAGGMSGMGGNSSVPIGQKVQSVKLEDSRTGAMFDLGEYLGKKDIVLVSYMGYFCLGCRELVDELERRTADFEAADAYPVVLGYETGQTGKNTAQQLGIRSYPLLQEGPPYSFTRSLGLWSDMMDMPFMGYVVIDRSGTIVAGEQASLSESKGAAPKNVDKLLAALATARQESASR